MVHRLPPSAPHYFTHVVPQRRQCSLVNLPDDLLTRIINFLVFEQSLSPPQHYRGRCSITSLIQCCKRIHRIVKNVLLTHGLKVSRSGNVSSTRASPCFCLGSKQHFHPPHTICVRHMLHSRISTINLPPSCADAQRHAFHSIVAECPKLHALAFHQAHPDTRPTVFTPLTKLKHLRHLFIVSPSMHTLRGLCHTEFQLRTLHFHDFYDTHINRLITFLQTAGRSLVKIQVTFNTNDSPKRPYLTNDRPHTFIEDEQHDINVQYTTSCRPPTPSGSISFPTSLLSVAVVHILQTHDPTELCLNLSPSHDFHGGFLVPTDHCFMCSGYLKLVDIPGRQHAGALALLECTNTCAPDQTFRSCRYRHVIRGSIRTKRCIDDRNLLCHVRPPIIGVSTEIAGDMWALRLPIVEQLRATKKNHEVLRDVWGDNEVMFVEEDDYDEFADGREDFQMLRASTILMAAANNSVEGSLEGLSHGWINNLRAMTFWWTRGESVGDPCGVRVQGVENREEILAAAKQSSGSLNTIEVSLSLPGMTGPGDRAILGTVLGIAKTICVVNVCVEFLIDMYAMGDLPSFVWELRQTKILHISGVIPIMADAGCPNDARARWGFFEVVPELLQRLERDCEELVCIAVHKRRLEPAPVNKFHGREGDCGMQEGDWWIIEKAVRVMEEFVKNNPKVKACALKALAKEYGKMPIGSSQKKRCGAETLDLTRGMKMRRREHSRLQ